MQDSASKVTKPAGMTEEIALLIEEKHKLEVKLNADRERLQKVTEAIQQDFTRYSGRNLENLTRVFALIGTYETLCKTYKPNEKYPAVKWDDILRSSVVFAHASLEDFLRTLATTYLPEGDENALNDVPLMGLSTHSKPEKFLLGKLVQHREKTVEELIRASVESYLERSNYNNTEQVSILLKSIGIDTTKVNHTFAKLDEMMQRRHAIVHRADRIDRSDIPGESIVTPLEPQEVREWVNAISDFVKATLDEVIGNECV